MATFPLSIIATVLSVEITGGTTLVIRGLVVFGGFGLAALWQVVLATLVSTC